MVAPGMRPGLAPVVLWDHSGVSGSTLYRRLPNGTWASEREDDQSLAASGAPEAVVAVSAGLAVPVAADAQAAPAGAQAASPSGQAPTRAPEPAGGQPPAEPPAQSPPPPPTGPPAAAPMPARPQPRPRRWGFWRVVRWAAVAYVAWLVGLALYLATSLPKVDALSPEPIADTPGTVWMLVGSDSREGLTARQRSRLRTGNEEGQRTDTIMLVHTPPGSSPTLISIPRDSWVTIPAHTARDGSRVGARKAKVNAAYNFGGASLLAQTIEYNTGLHVDNYVEIGFAGIVKLTNAVGGIEACFDRDIDDANSGLKVSEGCHLLSGRQALAYVRMRYSDPKGDIGRIERQQHYVSEVIHRVIDWRTLVSPVRQWELVNAALDAVTVDESTSVFDLGGFGLGMRRIAGGGGEVTVVPVDPSDHWESGQWVIHWDTASANRLFASLGGSTPQAMAEERAQ